jgi:hypothetical protein
VRASTSRRAREICWSDFPSAGYPNIHPSHENAPTGFPVALGDLLRGHLRSGIQIGHLDGGAEIPHVARRVHATIGIMADTEHPRPHLVWDAREYWRGYTAWKVSNWAAMQAEAERKRAERRAQWAARWAGTNVIELERDRRR